jgi:hypothetical protein
MKFPRLLSAPVFVECNIPIASAAVSNRAVGEASSGHREVAIVTRRSSAPAWAFEQDNEVQLNPEVPNCSTTYSQDVTGRGSCVPGALA